MKKEIYAPGIALNTLIIYHLTLCFQRLLNNMQKMLSPKCINITIKYQERMRPR